MKIYNRVLICLLAVLLLGGALISCNRSGELKKGTIIEPSESAWRPLTATVRSELDEIYEQKLAATQAFAALPAISGKIYYISSLNGNDSNSGLSPESAWKSPEKANDAAIKSGDAVLFQCGSVFRRTKNMYFLKTKSGVIYATYGEGAKPVFYGSVSVPSNKWVAVSGKPNVYYYENKSLDLASNERDIGNIVFNDGEAWGIKIQMIYNDPKTKTDPADQTLALKDVSNGLQTYASIPSYHFTGGADLRTYDLSYYHEYRTGRIYLYCEGGNPGTRFRSIELSMNAPAMQIGDGQFDVTILNMDFRYYGNDPVHPMNVTEDANGYKKDAVAKNTIVKNCSFYFIGGTVQVGYGEWRKYYTRMGNGITNYGACDGLTVENCYFDQIYDTAVSTQTEHNQNSKNITFRNNVMQNVWFGVELWAGDYTVDGLLFDNVEVSGNYCRKIGEGLCTTRPDKIEEGTNYSVNAFIKISHYPYQMENCMITDNIADGTNGKFILCSQPKTDANTVNGATFARNIYIGSETVDFGVLPSDFPAFDPVWDAELERYRLETKKYTYSKQTVELLQAHGFEEGSIFYCTDPDSVDCWSQCTYKAANGVELQFRLALPYDDTAGKTFPLVTFLNQESASGNDNVKNVTQAPEMLSALAAEQNAILLVPQCPSGTWTGLSVGNGNYETAKVGESEVMKAVAALIRDVAEQYNVQKKYAVGIDAGAYAVSDLLARHKDLLAAGIIIAGAGDPAADIGNAKAWIIHSEIDEVIPKENAEALAAAWKAEYTAYEWGSFHDCWDQAAKEDLLGWLLSK